jgi:tetratricopeptide (TPR) repeat protein
MNPRLLVLAAFLPALAGCTASGAAGPGPEVPTDPEGAGGPPVPGMPPAAGAVPRAGAASPGAAARPERAPRPRMSAAAAQAYHAGLQAFGAGDLDGARAQFSRAIAADPKAYAAHFSLGSVLERQGKKREALAAYERAREVVPDYERSIAAYADLLARDGDLPGAAAYLERLRAKMPESAAVLAALSEIKSQQGDSGAAQQLAQVALKKDPDYRPAMIALARDHYRSRRLDLALYTLKAILDGYGPENPARDRNSADAVLLRGLIHREQNKRAPALDDFRRAVELRPDLVEARLNLARYMLEAGNATEAAGVLEQGLRYDPANHWLHLALGDAYRLLGRPEPAIQHLEWVLRQDSTLAPAEYNLGLVYLFSANVPGLSKTQATEKAITHLTRYQEMRPRSRPGAGDDAAELLQRARNKKAVLEALAAQQQAAPASPEAPAAAPPVHSSPSPQPSPPPSESQEGSTPGSTGSFPAP